MTQSRLTTPMKDDLALLLSPGQKVLSRRTQDGLNLTFEPPDCELGARGWIRLPLEAKARIGRTGVAPPRKYKGRNLATHLGPKTTVIDYPIFLP